jgi:hypothetical protein
MPYRGLSRKDGAAFGSARTNDRTPATGFHTSPKTMGAGATYFGWLKSSFHDGIFLNRTTRARTTKRRNPLT